MKTKIHCSHILSILIITCLLSMSFNTKSQTLDGIIKDYSGKGDLNLRIYKSYITPNDVETISIKVNENGEFSQPLNFNSSFFGYISYSNPRQRSIGIYLEPEKTLEISFYEDSLAASIKFKGDLAKENQHYRNFNNLNTTVNRINIRTKVYSLSKESALTYLDSIKSLNLISLAPFKGTDYFNQVRSEIDYILAEDQLLNLLANHGSDNPEDFDFIDQLVFESASISNSYRFSNYFFFWFILAECIRNEGTDCSKDYLLKIQLINDNTSIENKEYPLALIIRDFLKTPNQEALNQLEWYKKVYKNSRYIKPLEQVLLAKIPFDSLKKIVKNPMMEGLDDKTILVNFWASWCGPCIKAIPTYNQLVKEYGDKNFTLLNFNYDDPKDFEKAKNIIDKKNFAGLHIFLDKDSREAINDIFYIQSLPRKLLYDKGNLIDLKFTDLKSLKGYIDN